MNDSKAFKKGTSTSAYLIVDGMSAVRSIKVKPTCGRFAEAFLEFGTASRYTNLHNLNCHGYIQKEPYQRNGPVGAW